MDVAEVRTGTRVVVEPVQAKRSVTTLRSVVRICGGCIAAINGDFFDVHTRQPLGGVDRQRRGVALAEPAAEPAELPRRRDRGRPDGVARADLVRCHDDARRGERSARRHAGAVQPALRCHDTARPRGRAAVRAPALGGAAARPAAARVPGDAPAGTADSRGHRRAARIGHVRTDAAAAGTPAPHRPDPAHDRPRHEPHGPEQPGRQPHPAAGRPHPADRRERRLRQRRVPAHDLRLERAREDLARHDRERSTGPPGGRVVAASPRSSYGTWVRRTR